MARETVSPAVQPPPGNPRFELVDAMRGIAVMLTIFCHTAGITGATLHKSWGWLGTYAYFGVIVFFAISGFLLYRPYAVAHSGGRAAPKVGPYARRRLLRIVPGYWFALTVLSIYPGIYGTWSSHWWEYYGFAQVYSVNTLTGGLAAAWSLCVEMSFYVFLPIFAAFMAWLVARQSRRMKWWQVEAAALVVFCSMALVAQIYVHNHMAPYWLANTLGGTSDWFAIGMGLAVMSVCAYDHPGLARRLSGMVERWSWVVWLAAIGMFWLATRPFDVRDLTSGRPGVYGVSAPVWLSNHLGLGLAAGLLLAPAVLGARGPVRWLLSWRPLTFLGLISYGVYLWHFPIAAWLGLKGAYPETHGGGLDIVDRVHTLTTVVLFFATLVVSVAVATVSYYVVECRSCASRTRVTATVARAPRRGGVPVSAAAGL
jgi:peptidoglycan/LPS O-acetylase OafA/YrhL